jgi:transketolase
MRKMNKAMTTIMPTVAVVNCHLEGHPKVNMSVVSVFDVLFNYVLRRFCF